MDKKDDIPAQPVHSNVNKNESDTVTTSNQASSHNNTVQPGEYVSNPFAITFQNFGKMFKHAQAVAIVMVIFGVLGSIGNVPNFSFDSSDFDEFRNNDFSVIDKTSAETSSNTIAQSQSAEEGIFEVIERQAENAETSDSNGISGAAIVAIILFSIVLVLIFGSIGLAISALWSGLVAAAANMAVRDRDITFGASFSQSASRFGTMFVALFISTLKIIGGYLLLLFPGIRAQARYAALPYVVMGNPSMSATQAVNETKRLYDGHLLESFSITWISSVIPFVGNVLGAVGLAQSARQIHDYKSRGLQKPEMSGWNWVAPLVSIGLLLLGLLLVAIIIAALAS